MAVTKRILPDAETILDLKTTLASKTMYKDAPNLYACLSEAFETDQFRGNNDIKPQALHDSITIPFEAHVRSELIYALGQQGFRHPYGPNHVVARKLQFKSLLPVVKADRAAHAAAAWKTRSKSLPVYEAKTTRKAVEESFGAIDWDDF